MRKKNIQSPGGIPISNTEDVRNAYLDQPRSQTDLMRDALMKQLLKNQEEADEQELEEEAS